MHVADRFGGGLLPENASGRARAIEWMFAALNTVEPPISDHAIATLFEDDKPWSKPRLPSVNERIDERFGELSRRLGDSEWLEGAFSAGDLLMVAVLRMMRGAPQLSRYPNLAAYVARGEARPAFRQALADQLAGFTGDPPPELAEWARNRGKHDAATQTA